MPNPSKAPGPDGLRELAASVQVLMRFCMRIVILGLFALASRQGFGRMLEGLLAFATFYCMVAATLRREALLGPTLTHFDEAAAYTAIACLAMRTV